MLTEFDRPTESTLLAIVRLLRWDKPAGRLILMIPALWAVFLAAHGRPSAVLVGVIVLGTLATSAAGCVINDLWDRDIDPEVERTRSRPLASRALKVQTAIGVALISFACAAILAFYLNPLSFWLCVAAVPVIICYPLAKRFFPVPQLVLSIAWGFAVLIGWSATVGKLELATWLLWGAVVLWTLGFDTVYAMSDREDDLRLGVNSSAIFFGDNAANAVGFFFVATVGLLAAIGINLHLHIGFWIAILGAAILWFLQYSQLRNADIHRPVYGQIFRQNVWVGFVILAGMIVGEIF
ncbi:MAG: 4-hydroxybenzoate solanesyltransferase [Tychonema bourrellyi B0820]|uniref:4-hydroxybenzoate solanesyltransferase n=1 Tax=Tychonema bourrellyi FEM_GT703 TaxID=2040638 RepID=A0A2G4F3Q5_9CYAN|nr:4-hydroxybenzoate solanesyltransferase [Tychonema bourrellyi]MDQ2096849.1 4-hydroxybenzoate solanesyltransferase [Tychonema bourrellyi B0820]PHX56389.1 4-hydroxybenzoate octaprenyltransferase [Tychonema bourrellyi FEM_GT703]